MGWSRGCLAAGLVRSSVCYYCLGRCSALVVCARRSRQVWGVGAGAGSCFSPWAPPYPQVLCCSCCGLSCPGVPFLSPAGTPFHAVCAFGAPTRCRSGPHRVSVACVCARAPAAYAPPPLWVGVARALWAVPVQGAGSPVPGSSCPSAFPALVPCSAYLALQGVARSLPPLALLGVVRPPAGRPAFRSLPCALLGRHKGARGGAPLAWVWGARGWALSHTRLPVLGVCGGGPLPAGCGCGRFGRWDPSPTPQRAPACGASRVRHCPLPDRPSLGRAAGARYLLAVGGGGGGLGNRSPIPQRALLRAGFARCGGHTRAPGWAASCLHVGRPGLGALPPPTARPLGVRPGTAARWHWVRGMCAWGPVTNPTARALARWLCALWGQHEGAQGGPSLPACGASRVGRSPKPDRPSLGVCPGRATHWLCVRPYGGVETRHRPHRARSCELALRCGGGTTAPGGGARCLRVGRPGLSALPRPTACLWSVRPGPATGWLWVRGVGAWGPVTNPTACNLASWLCALWGRQEGARGGVPLACICGVRGCALSDARLPVPGACGRWPATHWLLVRCAGVGGWLSLALSPVLRFAVCCARFPELRHPAAVVAWHLSVCLGCGRRRASLACLVAPREPPRLARSGRSRCSGRLS